MKSSDRCMNTDLYACTGPSYWTLTPVLRLCVACLKARFGTDPSSHRASDAQRAYGPSADPMNAPAPAEAGCDRRAAGATSPEPGA